MAEEIPFRPPAPQENLPPPATQDSFFDGFSFGGLAASLALGAVTAMLRPNRSIGFILADVTIEENQRDDLEITRHPVEIGAQITDHAYKQPSEVRIHCGWSDSGNFPGYVQAAHDSLLQLQASRVPFSVTTGKRTYQNMLMSSLSITTDRESENALMAELTCRQVILVATQTTQVAPRVQQVQPQNTAAVESTGGQQAKPVPESILHGFFGR